MVEDDWYDEGWNDEYQDDEAHDLTAESETVECPECGADVYEDTERCPVCGNYIVHSSSGYLWNDRPTWWIVIGFLGILAVVVALAFGP